MEKKNILIVDDEQIIREMMLNYLSQMMKQISSFVAKDADSALRIVEEKGQDFFDLFIIDVNMPEASGIELVGKLRELGIVAPVIMMSGFYDESSIRDSYELGAVCFLQKPDLEGLKKAISQMIEIAITSETHQFVYWEIAPDGSRKYRHLSPDYEILDAVSRKDEDEPKKDEQNWGCISSQTVCPLGEKGFGCVYCKSWLGKKPRNATLEELVSAISDIRTYSQLKVTDPLHIGINGIGDATLNPAVYDLLENPPGNESFRLSTPGITIPFKKFISVNNPLEHFVERVKGNANLRVFQGSLMAPNDELRGKIIRIGRVCLIKDLLKYGIKWATENDKIFYLNYIMIEGINDEPHHAKQLVELLKDLPVLVKVTKLIPCNGYFPSVPGKVKIFTSILSEGNIKWLGFLPKGADITGCGMLKGA